MPQFGGKVNGGFKSPCAWPKNERTTQEGGSFITEDQSRRKEACNGVTDECRESLLETIRTFPKKGSCIPSTMAQNGIGFSLHLLQSVDNNGCTISKCVWQISILKWEEKRAPKECSAPLFEKHNARQMRSQMQAQDWQGKRADCGSDGLRAVLSAFDNAKRQGLFVRLFDITQQVLAVSADDQIPFWNRSSFSKEISLP